MHQIPTGTLFHSLFTNITSFFFSIKKLKYAASPNQNTENYTRAEKDICISTTLIQAVIVWVLNLT